MPVQVLAGVAGGASSVLGLEKGVDKVARFFDGSMGERLMPKLNQRRFAARQAANKYRGYDREISSDLDNLVGLSAPNGAKARLSKDQRTALLAKVQQLDESYMPRAEVKAARLPASEKARLLKAMNERQILGEDALADLAEKVPFGNVVADSIRKSQRLRSVVPSYAAQSGSPALKFLGEAFGSSAGSAVGHAVGGALGGTAGSIAGSTLVRRLSRSSADTSADKALELASDARKWAQLPADQFGPVDRASARQALDKVAADSLDAPAIAKQETARLEAEGRKIGILNAQDDIRPGGGFRGMIYERAGLLPSQQDVGALSLLKDGKITPEQFDAFLNSPDKLMAGNAGNALTDRFAAMADDGSLTRDAAWAPPEAPSPSAPQVDASGLPIRSMPAYQAGAAAIIARKLQLMKELDDVDPVMVVMGEGPDAVSVRASEDPSFTMSEAERTRAAAIRAELSRAKSNGGNGITQR